jgi:SAM-dependent methyltransferase
MTSDYDLDPDDFAAYYAYAPAALALRECVRLRAVRSIDLPEPILDVGCGDGVFARLAYPDRHVWGIDVNPSEVRRAQSTATYQTLVCGSICDADLPRGYFRSAIANCSLEHVPEIDRALVNIRRSLAPGAPFVLIVPTPDWTRHLAVPTALERLGLGALARMYGDALDRTFFHVHLYDETKWTAILGEAGFTVDETRPIVSPGAAWAFDALLYPSLLGWATKKATGRWVLVPGARKATAALARAAIERIGAAAPGNVEDAPSEYLFVARASGAAP